MYFISDTELSLDSRKRRRVFEEGTIEESTKRERNRDLVSEYERGYSRLKEMRVDENMWQE